MVSSVGLDRYKVASLVSIKTANRVMHGYFITCIFVAAIVLIATGFRVKGGIGNILNSDQYTFVGKPIAHWARTVGIIAIGFVPWITWRIGLAVLHEKQPTRVFNIGGVVSEEGKAASDDELGEGMKALVKESKRSQKQERRDAGGEVANAKSLNPFSLFETQFTDGLMDRLQTGGSYHVDRDDRKRQRAYLQDRMGAFYQEAIAVALTELAHNEPAGKPNELMGRLDPQKILHYQILLTVEHYYLQRIGAGLGTQAADKAEAPNPMQDLLLKSYHEVCLKEVRKILKPGKEKTEKFIRRTEDDLMDNLKEVFDELVEQAKEGKSFTGRIQVHANSTLHPSYSIWFRASKRGFEFYDGHDTKRGGYFFVPLTWKPFEIMSHLWDHDPDEHYHKGRLGLFIHSVPQQTFFPESPAKKKGSRVA